MWYIYTMKYYSAVEKEQNNAICSNVNGPRDWHMEGSKLDRERQISCDIYNIWNVRKWYKWTYLHNRNRVTYVENEFMVTNGERRGDKLGDWDWCICIAIYKIDKQ